MGVNFCPDCGERLLEGKQFCVNCGASRPPGETATATTPEPAVREAAGAGYICPDCRRPLEARQSQCRCGRGIDWSGDGFWTRDLTLVRPLSAQSSRVPVAPAPPPMRTDSRDGRGWWVASLVLVGISVLMSVAYFPQQNDYWPEAVLLSAFLQPGAWVGVICAYVAQRRGISGAVVVSLLIWIIGALLGAIVAVAH